MKPKTTPKPLSTIITHTGLRITPQAISLTVTKQNQVVKHQEIALPAQAIIHGELKKPEEVKAVLLQLIKQASLPDKFVTLGMPEHQTFVKKMTVSSWKGSNREAVMNELEYSLPLPAEQLYVDWAVLPSSADLLQVAAIPKSVVDPYMELATAAGLTVLAIESTSLTLLRLLPKLETPTIIIDASVTTTMLVIEPDHSSSITAVAQADDINKLPDDLVQVLNDLKSYYQRSAQQEVGQIWLTGKFAEQALKLIGSTPPAALLPTDSARSEEQLGSALAQMPITPPEHPQTINLIPPTTQANYDQAASHHLQQRLLLISSICLLIGNLIAGGFLFQLIRRQSSTLPGPAAANSSLEQLNQVNLVNQQTKAINQITDQRQTFTQIVTSFLPQIPAGLQVNYLKFDAATKMVTIRGVAATRDQLLEFKSQLEQNPQFAHVTLPLSVLDKSENIEYSLTFKWESK